MAKRKIFCVLLAFFIITDGALAGEGPARKDGFFINCRPFLWVLYPVY